MSRLVHTLLTAGRHLIPTTLRAINRLPGVESMQDNRLH